MSSPLEGVGLSIKTFLLLGISLGNQLVSRTFGWYNEQLRSSVRETREKYRRQEKEEEGKGRVASRTSILSICIFSVSSARGNNEFITVLIRYKWHIWFASSLSASFIRRKSPVVFGRPPLLMRRRESERKRCEPFVIADLSANQETSYALTTCKR